MKKILYLNIIVIVLILVTSIGIFYGNNFPIPFDFIGNFKDYKIQYILIILLIIGFFASLYDEEIENKIDSIYKKYGVAYFNAGCIVDFIDIEAQKKYQETVKPYLIKRNGKNWELKMKSEIEKLKN